MTSIESAYSQREYVPPEIKVRVHPESIYPRSHISDEKEETEKNALKKMFHPLTYAVKVAKNAFKAYFPMVQSKLNSELVISL
ncbi:hypothetical protein HDU76_011752 [Blyttiomyces sp. JEL0837]|nr:hypothetical protein HDU76_011752 [Blyttiomyces sp. JEL0837]